MLRLSPSVPAGGAVVISSCTFLIGRIMEHLYSDGWPHLSFKNVTSEYVRPVRSKLGKAAIMWSVLQLTSPSIPSAPFPAAFVPAFNPSLLPLAGRPGLLIFSSPPSSPDTALCLVFLFTLPTSNSFRDGRSGPSSFSSVKFFLAFASSDSFGACGGNCCPFLLCFSPRTYH